MGQETVLFEREERTDLAGVAALLRELADRLEENEVVLRQGEEAFKLAVPSEVTLEIKVEEEVSGGKRERSLEVEIEWAEVVVSEDGEPEGEGFDEDEESEGEESEGETAEGEAAGSEQPGGEATESEAASGGQPGGEAAESEAAGGEQPGGEVSESEAMVEGEQSGGEVSEDEAASSEQSDGEVSEGEAAGAEAAQD